MNRADPAILGKIILLQSTVHAMNDDVTMARFVCRGLSSVPGITELAMLIRGKYISGDDQTHSRGIVGFSPPPVYEENISVPDLSANKNLKMISLKTILAQYGWLIFRLYDKKLFEIYKPYIDNTLNLVALVIENNTRKNELIDHKKNLESMVEERTAKLALANEELLKEIKERKNAENSLRNALKEKEILLRELYHRTKNNMQVIRSMLSIQANTISNEDVKKIFRETETRIQAMAMVHQKLYQSKDLSRINLKSYVQDLVEMIMESYPVMPGQISVSLSVADINVIIDMAIPCGLLLNELMSNALKHAFPDGRKGVINISIFTDPDDIITILFSDNGIGVTPDFRFRDRESLGLQTIFALCEHQLQGDIRFETKQGVSCLIHLDNKLFEERI